jgi:hypothetical protein
MRFEMTPNATMTAQNLPKPFRGPYPLTMSAPNEVLYASDQAALEAMPVAKPIPSRYTRVKESQRPTSVMVKIFNLDVFSG